MSKPEVNVLVGGPINGVAPCQYKTKILKANLPFKEQVEGEGNENTKFVVKWDFDLGSKNAGIFDIDFTNAQTHEIAEVTYFYLPFIANGDAYKLIDDNLVFITSDWTGLSVREYTPNEGTTFMIGSVNGKIYRDAYINGNIISIPENCILEFDGGSLENGVLEGNGAKFEGTLGNIFGNITFTGTFSLEAIDTDWFKDLSKPNALKVINPLIRNNICKPFNIYVKDKGYEYLFDMKYPVYEQRMQSGLDFSNVSDATLNLTAVLRVMPCAAIGYRLINLNYSNNINIIGGELIGDRAEHDYTTEAEEPHESCHGIGIYNSVNVTIEDMEIHDFPGDCMGFSGFNNIISEGLINDSIVRCTCRNITIRGCKLHDSRRQGISITNSENSRIENCEIYNIKEIPAIITPGYTHHMENGIEIEPNRYTDTEGFARNIIIDNCHIHNCVYGIRNVALPATATAPATDTENMLITNTRIAKITKKDLWLRNYNTRVVNVTLDESNKSGLVNIGGCFVKIENLKLTAANNSDIIEIESGASVILKNSELYGVNIICNYANLAVIESCTIVGIPVLNHDETRSTTIRNSQLILRHWSPKGTIYMNNNSVTFSAPTVGCIDIQEEVTMFIENNKFFLLPLHQPNSATVSYIKCSVAGLFTGVINQNVFNCYGKMGNAISFTREQNVVGKDNIYVDGGEYYTMGYSFLSPIFKLDRPNTTIGEVKTRDMGITEVGKQRFCIQRNNGTPVFWNGNSWVNAEGFSAKVPTTGSTENRPCGMFTERSGNINFFWYVGTGVYDGYTFFNEDNEVYYIASDIDGNNVNWKREQQRYGRIPPADAKRSGTTEERPDAEYCWDYLYDGFEYYDTTISKWLYLGRGRTGSGTAEDPYVYTADWHERPKVYGLTSPNDIGFRYFDTGLGKPVFAKEINGHVVTWVNGVGTRLYDIKNILNNIASSGVLSIEEGCVYNTILTPDEEYSLPTTITVNMGSDTLTVGTDYTYDPATGEVSILGIGGSGGITGNVQIIAEGVQ